MFFVLTPHLSTVTFLLYTHIDFNHQTLAFVVDWFSICISFYHFSCGHFKGQRVKTILVLSFGVTDLGCYANMGEIRSDIIQPKITSILSVLEFWLYFWYQIEKKSRIGLLKWFKVDRNIHLLIVLFEQFTFPLSVVFW